MRMLKSKLFALFVALLVLGGYSHQAIGFCALSVTEQHLDEDSQKSKPGKTEKVHDCCLLNPSAPVSIISLAVVPLNQSVSTVPVRIMDFPQGVPVRIERPPRAS